MSVFMFRAATGIVSKNRQRMRQANKLSFAEAPRFGPPREDMLIRLSCATPLTILQIGFSSPRKLRAANPFDVHSVQGAMTQ